MNKRNYLVVRLFLVFFAISVSVAVLPCGIINVHGLFGEEITYTVVEDKEQEVVNIKSVDHKTVHTAKGENIFNLWFEILIAVICISFCANLVKLPQGDTIVTLKVRMDN
jgi:phosphate/sulfate permease